LGKEGFIRIIPIILEEVKFGGNSGGFKHEFLGSGKGFEHCAFHVGRRGIWEKGGGEENPVWGDFPIKEGGETL